MFSFPTALGECALDWDPDGITRVHLPRVAATRRRPLGAAGSPVTSAIDPPADPIVRLPASPTVDPPAHVRAAAELIARLLAGEPVDLRGIPVSHDRRVAPFARRVYALTREIGPGETTTYGELARRLAGDMDGRTERPAREGYQLARAVGAALGANPTPIIVPCHRVLAADGSLHGFSAPGGITTKRRLLEIEGAPGFAQQPLFA
ncbi:MAG TPA: MGMT family protein [Solirubrobacteraceae bacterium]|nr:MGMT family protein [Solirubrobacteraceae bacterium]